MSQLQIGGDIDTVEQVGVAGVRMEDKKLNFSRPFLSVRRNSPAVTSQKDEKSRTGYSVAATPQLPSYRSELKSGPLRNPGAVPFQWERTPGQPKEVSKQENRNHNRPPIAPRLPPGRCQQASQQHSPNENSSQIVTVACDSQSGQQHDQNFKNFERYDEITEKGTHSESGDSDEIYVDAPDTLSRTESFSINCSVSGLSGFDDLDTKPSESFLTDPKTLEFMMDRFLPAAKAMASETPQCASKKESIREQSQQSKKIVSGSKPLLRYGPSFAKRYSYCHETEEQEEEESDDDYDHKKISGVCGLLPRFCSRSSVGFLNAVPAMSMKTRVPIYAANTNQARSSSARSYSKADNESKPDNSKLKSMDTIQTSELGVNKTNSGNERVQLEIRTSTSCNGPFSFTEEQEVTGVPEETKHTGINAKTFQELLADQGSPEESGVEEPVLEKILYVDTMKIVETESTASCSPPAEEDATGVPISGEVLNKLDQMQLMDISPEAIKKLDIGYDREKLPLDGHRFDGLDVVPAMGKLNLKGVMDVPEAHGEKNEDINLSSTMTKKVKVVDSSESLDNLPPKALAPANWTHPNHSRFPVPPCLPKSPSDSWLGRTLPSISTKKSYIHSSSGVASNPQNHERKAPRGDITWETFVKSTKVREHHSCHSKELLTPIPEG